MPYLIADIEVTQPLPALTLSGDETGVGVLVRRKSRPVGFWMEPLPAGTTLSPDALSSKIKVHAGDSLLRDSLREELSPRPRPTPHPSLTIAICTRDRTARLARCLASLDDLYVPSDDSQAPWDVLVVDNAPSDNRTRDLVTVRPKVRYVCEPRPGLDFARNRAAHEATGELIAFLDDDVTVDRYWLVGLMEAWADHPDAACYTGLVLPYVLETEAQTLFEAHGGFRRGFDKIRYQGQERPENPLYPCGAGIFGAGANMSFRRDVLLQLGGFDDALDTGGPLPGGGDLDMFYRVIRAGYPLVYEPTYLVFHEHRRTLDELRRQYWSWGLGFMAFVGKTYHTDPGQRAKLRRLVWWWLKYQARQLWHSLQGRHVLPPQMILAEMGGGVGLLGAYARSQRRAEQIRHQFGRAGGTSQSADQ